MPPPPPEPFAARIFLGPALRTQSDRRLVTLVREGYETAFEEIVRRYRKPLDRFAAVFVGDRSEDVTQDAFSKALLALRGSEKEIELRPWLYRIVRNTALNDLRDRPAAAEQLGEAIAGGQSAAVEAERREEMAELMERLRALPEPQRAAIVMRELEGLSHEEIAAALGVSGGAARQAIYRARAALRDGFGLLLPLPLLRTLFDHGAEAAGAGGAAAAAGAASAAGGGAAMGGLGVAGAFKVGVATAVLAGSVGAGVAIQNDRGGDGGHSALPVAEAAELPGGESAASPGLPSSSGLANSGPSRGDDGVSGGNRGPGGGDDGIGDGHRGRDGKEDDSGRGRGGEAEERDDAARDHSRGPGSRSGHGGGGSEHGGSGGSDDDRSGEEGVSGGSHSSGHGSGKGTSGGGGSGVGGGDSGEHGGRSGGDDGGSDGSDNSSGSGSGHGSGGSGSSGSPAPEPSPPPSPEPLPDEAADDPDEDSGGGSGSGSGGDSSGSGSDGS
jgi:RNA polymerase sigma factor (sigma-70 family)